MENNIKEIKNRRIIILIAIYSIYFFNQRESIGSFFLIIVGVLWWLVHLKLRFEERSQDSLLTLMIYSLPLSFISVMGSGSHLVFINWFNLFSLMYLINRLWFAFRKGQINKFNQKITIGIFLSFVGLILSFIVNKNQTQNHALTQMMIMLFYLFVVFIAYLSEISIGRSKSANERLYKRYNETVVILALFVLLQYVLYVYFDIHLGRIESFGGNRIAYGFLNFDYSFLSLYLVSGLFFVLRKVYYQNKINLIAFINSLLLVYTSILTSARTGVMAVILIGSLLVLLNVLILNSFKLSKKKRLIITLFSTIALLALILFVGMKRGFYGSGRIESFELAIEAIKQNIIFGNGLDYFVTNVNPHNFFLQYWLQTGLVFLVPITTTLVLISLKTYKTSQVVFYNLLTIFIGAMFIPDIIVSRFFGVMLILAVLAFKEVKTNVNKKSVAHLLNSGGYSGAEKVVISLIEGTPSSFLSSYVSLNGPIESILEEKNINHLALPSNNSFNTRLVITRNNTDIVYAHDFKSSLKAGFLFSDKIVISHIHQNPDWFSKLNIKTMMFLLASLFFSKIVYVSEEAMDSFYFSSVVKNKSFVLLNHVNKKEVIDLSNLTLDKIYDKYDVAYLGRIEPVKNPLKFIDIISEVKKTLPSISVVMMGDGSLRDAVNLKIIQLGLSENIDLIGYQSNPYPILKKSKLMVIPSQWEGFGLSAVESLLLGVPVIGSNVGGLKSILKDGAGILCDSDAEFANGILKLLSNDEALQDYALKGNISAERFTNHNEWIDNISNLFELYQ